MHGRNLRMMLASMSVVMVASFALLLVVPGEAEAADHAIAIGGYVYDSAGTPIDNIPIVITMKVGETVLSSKPATSSTDGGFARIFTSTEWEVDCTVQIVATGPAGQAVSTTTATNVFAIFLDVQFAYEIPEFGFDWGLLVAGLGVGSIAVVALVWKRK